MVNKIYELSDSDFRSLIENSLNISEVLFKLGYTVKGNSWGFSQVRKRMEDLNIPYYSFKGKSPMIEANRGKKLTSQDLLKENCKHNRRLLRKFIINNNLIPYKCAICGTVEWQGRTLSLELDHINGINDDNRLENLRFLCPNCHSQTDTYGSRNKQCNESRYEISKELENLIIQTYEKFPNLIAVARKLNIRRKVVHQVLSKNGLLHSNQKYVIRLDENKQEIQRFGSIAECCKFLMENNEVNTRKYKTCRASLLRNVDKFWKNSYWMLLDA